MFFDGFNVLQPQLKTCSTTLSVVPECCLLAVMVLSSQVYRLPFLADARHIAILSTPDEFKDVIERSCVYRNVLRLNALISAIRGWLSVEFNVPRIYVNFYTLKFLSS